MTTPTMPMVGVLPVQVGAGALLHGGGDLLHARGAGVRRQNLLGGDEAVDQRQQSTGDDHDVSQLHLVVRSLLRPGRRGARGGRTGKVGAGVCQIGEQVANARPAMAAPDRDTERYKDPAPRHLDNTEDGHPAAQESGRSHDGPLRQRACRVRPGGSTDGGNGAGGASARGIVPGGHRPGHDQRHRQRRSLNGTQFVVQQSAGVTQFIFNGDLNIGTSDNITGTGSNFASFKALNNANIAPGAIFNFSGSGASAGAGGGLGGTGQLGGSAGQGAFGGQGGFASPMLLGAGQARVSTCSTIPLATLAPPEMPEVLVGTVRSAATGSADHRWLGRWWAQQ